MPIDSALLASLLAPIPGEAPAGADLRYDPRYDAIKEARREDPDLGPADDGPRKVADWAATDTQIRELLTSGTKDLQLAGWITEAWLHRQGAAGLATGFALLRGLLEQYWDGLYPAIEEEDDLELRAGPLEWVGARLDVPVRQMVIASGGITWLDHQLSRGLPTEQEAEANDAQRKARAEAASQGRTMPETVDAAIGSTNKAFYKALAADLDLAAKELVELERTSDDRFGRDAPAFTATRKALEEVQRTVAALLSEKLLLDPDPVDEIAEDGESHATVEGDGSVPLDPVSPADAANRIAAAARYLRRQDPTNPAPYLLLRGFRWGELRATPGDVDARLLEAPPTTIRARLKGLLLDARWSELLEQGEELMAKPQARGWLDLQRYALTACGELGASYDAVAAAIRSELAALLRACPALPTMTLMDDTPTANEETRQWLAAEQASDAAASDDAATPAPDADADATDESFEDTPADDGTEAVVEALEEDASTAAHGGLARATPRRRSSARMPGARADVFTLARQELAAGRPHRAIERLVDELARERSPRGRHLRQTQIAWVMVEAGLDAVAQPILEKLVETIDERSLEDWESGPLLAQPMALLIRVYKRLDVQPDKRWELYLRVCRLDAMQALGLDGG